MLKLKTGKNKDKYIPKAVNTLLEDLESIQVVGIEDDKTQAIFKLNFKEGKNFEKSKLGVSVKISDGATLIVKQSNFLISSGLYNNKTVHGLEITLGTGFNISFWGRPQKPKIQLFGNTLNIEGSSLGSLFPRQNLDPIEELKP